jgi:hypothetical protein
MMGELYTEINQYKVYRHGNVITFEKNGTSEEVVHTKELFSFHYHSPHVPQKVIQTTRQKILIEDINKKI